MRKWWLAAALALLLAAGFALFAQRRDASPPPSAADSELAELCAPVLRIPAESLVERISPDRLEAEYPLGYAVFATNGELTRHRAEEVADWIYFEPRKVTVAKLEADELTVSLPDIADRELNAALSSEEIRIPRQEGFRTKGTFGRVQASIEVLATSERGVAFAVGFREVTPAPERLPD